MRKKRWLGFFVGSVVLFAATRAFAADEGTAAVLSDEVKKWLALGAGFAIGVAAFGGALAQGRAIASAVEGVARNPGAAGKIFAPTLIVGLALIESLVLYAWIVALQLSGKI